MKKWGIFLLFLICLSGCSASEEIERGMNLRASLLRSSGGFDAEITADYGEKCHIFSIKSLFNINFTQMFSKDNFKKNGLLISSETNKNFDGFVEIKFTDDFVLEEIDQKGLYKFIINKPNKYPYPLYINTNLGILTSKVLNDKIIDDLYKLRSYTRSNYSICIFKNKLYIYINGWELRIIDSFRKKLTYNSIDKKIDSFTKLIDDLQDLYICILRNYEVIKYGK